MDKQIGRQSKLLLNGQTDRHVEGYVRRQAVRKSKSKSKTSAFVLKFGMKVDNTM